MNRLFVAIDLPEPVRKSIVDLACALPGARWVAMEQLHLTLRFIGAADDLTMRAIRTALQGVTGPSFSLALSGIGHFPPGKHPRVLWVGLTACEQLLALQQQVELCLMEAGIPPDERQFSPHITIARLKETPARLVLALEEREMEFATESFDVSEFHLYASTLTSAGAIHTILESYPLAG
ncbi:RNA 2',3'-cyclic phosphodiesterase [Geotalea sp. SG265]|uniref:RNA 2',3'-cyclic phosphodiesterase n=1 Tax=Geotalea sp. SG265 TaxID=2922867 RepID=UPI001FAFE138|nr:RNA 2',3'-cyclic phosphodiesterase [Geotalea sp. SG265]